MSLAKKVSLLNLTNLVEFGQFNVEGMRDARLDAREFGLVLLLQDLLQVFSNPENTRGKRMVNQNKPIVK